MSGGANWARGVAADSAARERDDFYPTPPAAVRALLAVERFDGLIWEPACGDGAISEVLLAAGYKVFSSDLIDRGYGLAGWDFRDCPPVHCAAIVTNPPFKLAAAFVELALGRVAHDGGKVALLLRLAFLEGVARRTLFEATPLARIWVFAGRLTMTRRGDPELVGGGGMIAFAWFVWHHGHRGPPALGWIDDRVEGSEVLGSSPSRDRVTGIRDQGSGIRKEGPADE